MTESSAPSTRVSTFRDDALGRSDTVELLERLARREVSPAELLDAARERARIADGVLNGIVSWVADPQPDPDTADAPLAGIPSMIKDNDALIGLPTTEGSRAVALVPERRNSVWVQQYVDLGALPFAKTTLPEFGLTSTTESLLLGATRNPWNPGYSCGGSSGGAAAMVAAGVVPIAHANDGGGSIRIPASCCGVVGLKPSRGRIADEAYYDKMFVNLVTQGVVTRSVRDTALYVAAAERLYRNPKLPAVGHVTEPIDRPLRIALLTQGHGRRLAEAGTVGAIRSVAALCESLGHEIEEIDYPWTDQLGVDFLRYWALIAYVLKKGGKRLYGRDFRPDLVEPFTDMLARFLGTVVNGVPRSIQRLRRFELGYDETFVQYDVMLSPVLAHEPPPIGYLGPDVPPRTHLLRLLQYMSITPMHNISGAPSISLPMAISRRGLPMGALFSARRGEEALLLRLALQLEQARPWPLLADA